MRRNVFSSRWKRAKFMSCRRCGGKLFHTCGRPACSTETSVIETVVRPWPWRIYWLWPDNVEPRPTDRFAVLRWFTSAAYRTSPGTNFSVPVAHCCTRSFPIGLLQQCPVWLPANHIQRLQSIQNAAARLIFRIRRSALISLHWLRVPERISFKLAVMTYRSIHVTSPSYLQSCFTRVAGCGFLPLIVRLSTVNKRAFPFSSATVWRICAVTRGFQTTNQDLSVFPFLPRHYHKTRVLLLPFVTIVWTPVVLAIINIISATIKMFMMMMMMMMLFQFYFSCADSLSNLIFTQVTFMLQQWTKFFSVYIKLME